MIYAKVPLVLLCAVFVLVSCASQPTVLVQDLEARQAYLATFDNFSFRGGLGIWTDDETQSARINWQQGNGELKIDLSGPLGLGDLKLEYDGALAVLTRSGKNVAQGNSIDRVLQQGLGLEAPVPIEQLQQWVKGLVGAGTSVSRDEQGKLASLWYTDEQGTRWQARFLRYSVSNGYQLPSLISASGGPYSVRLVLKDWQSTATTSVPKNLPEETQPNKRLVIPSR